MSDFKLKRQTANLSVVSNLILTLLKLTVGVLTSSMSIVSEAFHSGTDLVAALVARFAVVGGMKPPDEKHRFGHGKLENFGSLIEATLIFIASIVIIYFSILKMISGVVIQHIGVGIFVMIFSAVANTFVGLRVKKVAMRTDSPALEADALHILSDAYCSMGVLFGLLIIFTGEKLGFDLVLVDPVLAIIIAVYISYLAYNLLKKATDVLLDTRLPKDQEDAVVRVIERHYGQIVNFHALRTRKSGNTKHIDLHIVVPKDRPVEAAHRLCDQLEREIRSEIPRTDIVIHVEPCDEDCDECVLEEQECRNK